MKYFIDTKYKFRNCEYFLFGFKYKDGEYSRLKKMYSLLVWGKLI